MQKYALSVILIAFCVYHTNVPGYHNHLCNPVTVLAYAANVGDADDAPTTYQQAMDSDDAEEWAKAMSTEIKYHSDNGSWKQVPKMKEVRPIGCRWVFAKKRNEHGHVGTRPDLSQKGSRRSSVLTSLRRTRPWRT